MNVSGVAPPATAALASAAQTAQTGAQNKPQDGAQIRQFDGLMQPSDTHAANASAAAGQPAAPGTPNAPTQAAQTVALQSPTTAVQMTPQTAPSSLVERLRDFTTDLDTRYSKLQNHQVQMLTSMTQNANDPMMAMAQAMDFQWSATTTISEYQLSLAVAQATNGLTHSILKNQE
ncbi:hypothetical protein [Paraburkholderia sediminicola]|uniref:hypothetical protein n=1 Tax=Paraburkholderia sediminicola TaxID=458836 RepID=UPI0038B999D6